MLRIRGQAANTLSGLSLASLRVVTLRLSRPAPEHRDETDPPLAVRLAKRPELKQARDLQARLTP
jgi:hypothetical protein